ncbi:hypothetical protein HY479_01225 [Candidatus Uhrbacteria bacterium]|nr:hypothetical protein [Candidatus Uhrbacteria bacterium]
MLDDLLDRWAVNPGTGYLFIGPRRSEKFIAAERFVRALLGVSGDVDLRLHPDAVILEPEEGKVGISVDAVRKARIRLSARPSLAPRQILFAPQADRLREEGMSALLKILEEPPAGAVFLFVAEDLGAFPATVLSRLMNVPFVARGRHVPRPDVAAAATAFLGAPSVGTRMELIEMLAKRCDAAADPTEEWAATCEDWGETFRVALAEDPRTALVAGQAVVTARRFVGGPLSPRLPLEAAAVRLGSDDPFRSLFPTPISPPVPSIFLG